MTREDLLRAGKKERPFGMTLYWEPFWDDDRRMYGQAFTVDCTLVGVKERSRFDTLEEADTFIAMVHDQYAVQLAKTVLDLN
jgi:hypothetical protein